MSQKEIEKGRIPLWLDPNEIEFLANEWRKIPGNTSTDVKDHWASITFKCSSALHKNGIKYEPRFPSDEEKYRK